MDQNFVEQKEFEKKLEGSFLFKVYQLGKLL